MAKVKKKHPAKAKKEVTITPPVGAKVGVNLQDLANHFGVSRHVVQTTWIPRGCPYLVKGGQGSQWRFDLAAVAKWRQENQRRNAAGENKAGTLVDEQRRLTAAKADVEEIKAARLRAELVEMSTVARMLSDLFVTMREKMRTIPAKVAPAISGGNKTVAETRAMMAKEIDDVLEELSDFDPGSFAEQGAENLPQSASEPASA